MSSNSSAEFFLLRLNKNQINAAIRARPTTPPTTPPTMAPVSVQDFQSVVLVSNSA